MGRLDLPWLNRVRAHGGGDRLELWLPPDWPQRDAELRWRRMLSGGGIREGTQHGLAGIAPAESIVVWTPATESLLARTRLPTRSSAKIIQALPFALEEQLTEPPERLHFAFAPDLGGELAVAVTSRARMDGWLAALSAGGLSPSYLAPVTLSLPLAERAWTLAFTGDEIVLRSGLRAGVGGPMESHPPAWLHALLAEARADSSAPERILTIDAPAGLNLETWREALGLPLEPMLRADAVFPATALNLLQQTYAPRSRMANLWRGYVPAAALVAASFAAMLVFDAIEWGKASSAARSIDAEMQSLLKRSFPETRTIIDPPEQMRRGLEELAARGGGSAPDDMLSLLARAAPVIQREPRVRVQTIEYNDRTLSIRAVASESDAASLSQSLRAKSLQVESQRSGGEVRFRVRATQTQAPSRGKS